MAELPLELLIFPNTLVLEVLSFTEYLVTKYVVTKAVVIIGIL